MWNGTSWVRVYAGVDETLSWTTQANSSYTLATDGSTSTVTTVASDPEGFPIEYSHDTNPTSQSQATITDNSDGTFTLTPSTVEANAGTFTLRTKASDGLRNIFATSDITLSFKHPYNNTFIQTVGNANYDASGVWRADQVVTLGTSYTTSGSDTIVTDSTGAEWKLFANFGNTSNNTGRWGNNKLSTYSNGTISTTLSAARGGTTAPYQSSTDSYIEMYKTSESGSGAGALTFYADQENSNYRDVKINANNWSVWSMSGAARGYANINMTLASQTGTSSPDGAFWIFKFPQGTSEVWTTTFNNHSNGPVNIAVFNESDGAITSQSGHGQYSVTPVTSGVINHTGAFSTILSIANDQRLIIHEASTTIAGIQYVLYR